MSTVLLSSITLIALSFILVNLYNFQMAGKLRHDYRQALSGDDIERAIDAGRAYYSKAHGTFTAVEESAIRRDLAKNGLAFQGGVLNR